MKWDIITVTFNSSQVLKTNWEWFSDWSDRLNWIVVDNASEDDTVQVARNLGAQVLQNSRNLGFGTGCNQGFRYSVSPFVLFANPDLRIQPEGLSIMESTMNHQDCLISPQLLNPDGSLQNNGRGKPYLSAKLAHRGLRFLNRRLDTYLPTTLNNQLTQVTWLMGACIATKRETFIKVGCWDESYFIYYEDHDLGIRANELGIKVLVDSRIQWHHEWARATKTLNFFAWYHELRSASIFYRKFPELLR